MTQRKKRIGTGIIALAAVMPFLTTVANADSTAPPAARTSALSTDQIQVLQSRVEELKALSSTLDALITQLTKTAENALDNADSAPNFDDRSRYEQLYRETSQRIGELQTQKTQLDQLVAELQTKLEAIQRAQ